MVEHYWRNLHRIQGNLLRSFPVCTSKKAGRASASETNLIYLDLRNLAILVTEHPSAIPVVICS